MLTAGVMATALTGCTFGILKTDECLKYYGEGIARAASEGRLAGPIAEESYGFCLDGHGRAKAMVAVLQAHGFATDGPRKHFEVPGGWCLSGKRETSAGRFDAKRSLDTVCAIGHASKAFMTGGALVTSNGKEFTILSTFDRRAREELDERLARERAE